MICFHHGNIGLRGCIFLRPLSLFSSSNGIINLYHIYCRLAVDPSTVKKIFLTFSTYIDRLSHFMLKLPKIVWEGRFPGEPSIMNNFPNLFSPTKIGNLALKNRITMAPTFMAYGHEDGTISAAMLEHYRDMARSGVGLVVVENVHVNDQHSRFGRLIRADRDEDIPQLDMLARTIKESGAIACCQINFGGRLAMVTEALAPSPVPFFNAPPPREMTRAEIQTVIGEYAATAVRIQKAGFDLVEIHGATGYLPCQFLSPRTNQRADEYGGSLANRMRFVNELISRVREATGGDYPIGYRFMADEWDPAGFQLAEAKVVAGELEKLGVAYLSVTAGTYESIFTPEKLALSRQEGYMAGLAAEIKQEVSVPVIAAGRIATPDLAENLIATGKTDLVGLARVLLADPQWPRKAEGGAAAEIISCPIDCDVCLQLVMKQQPVICASWTKERKMRYNHLLNAK